MKKIIKIPRTTLSENDIRNQITQIDRSLLSYMRRMDEVLASRTPGKDISSLSGEHMEHIIVPIFTLFNRSGMLFDLYETKIAILSEDYKDALSAEQAAHILKIYRTVRQMREKYYFEAATQIWESINDWLVLPSTSHQFDSMKDETFQVKKELAYITNGLLTLERNMDKTETDWGLDKPTTCVSQDYILSLEETIIPLHNCFVRCGTLTDIYKKRLSTLRDSFSLASEEKDYIKQIDSLFELSETLHMHYYDGLWKGKLMPEFISRMRQFTPAN